MVKVGNKILEIYKEVVNKESKSKTADSKEMHSMLKVEITIIFYNFPLNLFQFS